MLCGCESWTSTEDTERKIEAYYRKLLCISLKQIRTLYKRVPESKNQQLFCMVRPCLKTQLPVQDHMGEASEVTGVDDIKDWTCHTHASPTRIAEDRDSEREGERVRERERE